MEPVIKLTDVDLIYRSAESLSFKKVIKNLLFHGQDTLLHRYKALNNISITMEKGKVYGIIGNNGAGKSTLLRVLSGVMSPNSGAVERHYKTINLLALGVGFSKELSGYDNIYLNGMLLGFNKKQIAQVFDDIVAYSELGDFIARPMKTYSSGMVSRLGFAIAIHLKPEVLLIDEVLSVGDVNFRQKSFNSIRQIISDRNITVAIVTHSIAQVESLCDRIIWLDKGRLVAQGETADVMELYGRFNAGKVTVEQILAANVDAVIVQDNRMVLSAGDYDAYLSQVEKKSLEGRDWDFIRQYRVGKAKVKLTKRRLENQDLFLYFEVENPGDCQVEIQLDSLGKRFNFDHLYQKPPFDKRYGENRITGPWGYLDLKKGSALVSKVYAYKPLTKDYPDGSSSRLLELEEELEPIAVEPDGRLLVRLDAKAPRAAFFVLISREKLFRDEENLRRYMEYHYDSVFNNSVWSSFFMLPSGTYTKLPYSIEPFTKEGYGYSLHHSSRKDLHPFYNQTRERFFEDMIVNAVLQAYLYQENENQVFYTPYTSTWIKKDTGITAPYIDTRLNETFIRMLQDFQEASGKFEKLNPMRSYVEFLCDYYESGQNLYRMGDGVFLPDYFKPGAEILCHASLNHQIGMATLLIKAYEQWADQRCIALARAILLFVENTAERWIKPENGDLYYGVKKGDKDGGLEFYGDDYVYVTLQDLLLIRQACINLETLGNSKMVDRLIKSKVEYLSSTEYDIFNPDAKCAPGEKIDAAQRTLEMYKRIYP